MAINYLDLPIGRKYPYEVDCVVEIGKDTNLKYEYDERLHVFRLDRCLLSSMSYPCTYGFIPSTKADDGDALDMLIHPEGHTQSEIRQAFETVTDSLAEAGGVKDSK